VENGLPDNYTFAIEKFQDEIYVATDGGLVTFNNGNDFKIHNRKKIRYPVALLNHKDSILYVGSWLDGILTKQKDSVQTLYTERINRILKNEGKTLIYNTYRRYALLAFNAQRVVDTIISLDERFDKDRRIAIDSTSVYITEGSTITTYDWNGKSQGKFPYETNEKIETINSIRGFLFFGDLSGNLTWVSKKNPAQKTTYHFKEGYNIKHIEPYTKQQILVQCNHRAEYNSIYLLTFDETFSKVIASEPILTIKYGISDIFVDQETIYIASYGNGVYKLFPSIFKSYLSSDYQITIPKFSYENDAGNMVFATENLSYTLHDRDTFIPRKNLFRLNNIFEFQGERYFSSHQSLFDANFKEITGNRVNNFVLAAEKDTVFYSKYWLSRFHNGDREDIYCMQYNKKDKKINTGIYFNNAIYIGTQNSIRKFVKNEIDLWMEIEDPILQNDLEQRVVREMIPLNNQFVISTPYEAYTYNGRILSPLFITEEDIHINDTYVDNKQRIYFGTNKGFWIITDDFQYHFNTKNGTNSNNIYSFYQDNEGIIWIITGNGIMEFNPNLLDVTVPPTIEIHKTEVYNDQVSIQFKSSTRHFAESVLLQYKINNSEWRTMPNQQLEMSNLKPGNYSVAFRAKRMNSLWSIPQTTRFRIEPKWYQITVIKIFIFIAITVILLGFLWYRLRVIKRRNETLSNEINRRIFLEHKVENLREEVARDFHDEIGNKIASVIGLSNNLKHSEKVTSPKVDKITSLSKEVYHTAKDFVWSLNPKNNNIESLCRYLRDYGENFFDLFDEIDFLYQEIDIIPIDISYVKSRNLILAFKEILSNIIKHSQATKVTFKVHLQDNKFTIQIQDNGIGIHDITSTNGNGLKNIKKRMEMINAEMYIEKSAGVFYTFILDLKEELTKTNEL
jgi:signal transduction histidine kinase